RQFLLMRAPSELGRLKTFRYETVDRPRVPECIEWFRFFCALRVPLGDMNSLDSELFHEARPALARTGRLYWLARILGDIEKGLFYEPGHHPRIRSAAADGGWGAGIARLQFHDLVSKRVVRSQRGAELGIVVKSWPRLDHGVDTK